MCPHFLPVLGLNTHVSRLKEKYFRNNETVGLFLTFYCSKLQFSNYWLFHTVRKQVSDFISHDALREL